MTETWKDVVGYEGTYQVSDLGRVRSFHNGKWGTREQPVILKPGDDGHVGHLAVNLRGAGGARRGKVHRLVHEAFHGPIPLGYDVRHGDGNPKNNRADNLTVGSRLENMADALRHGTIARGERMPLSKLNDELVKEARIRYASGERTQQQLATEYGVSRRTMGSALRGETWAHVQ